MNYLYRPVDDRLGGDAAAAGTPPAALQARHSDYSTTQLYIDLAGETFREEAERLEQRLAVGD